MGIISCLEKRSREGRNAQVPRSDYSRVNEYTALHPNARATGDAKGKGVGGSHGHWLPNCNGQLGIFRFDDLITDVNSGAGNSTDNIARQEGLTRSLYSHVRPYEYQLIDSTMNRREGQYYID